LLELSTLIWAYAAARCQLSVDPPEAILNCRVTLIKARNDRTNDALLSSVYMDS
jgi:hypothetical protein